PNAWRDARPSQGEEIPEKDRSESAAPAGEVRPPLADLGAGMSEGRGLEPVDLEGPAEEPADLRLRGPERRAVAVGVDAQAAAFGEPVGHEERGEQMSSRAQEPLDLLDVNAALA